MFGLYKENKKLKEEIEELQARYDRMQSEETTKLFNLSYYDNKIDELNEKVKKLQKELMELYEKNYELSKKLNER